MESHRCNDAQQHTVSHAHPNAGTQQQQQATQRSGMRLEGHGFYDTLLLLLAANCPLTHTIC